MLERILLYPFAYKSEDSLILICYRILRYQILLGQGLINAQYKADI